MNLDFKIISCGGITTPEAFMKHIHAGADYVLVATSALFIPELPFQIAKYLNENKVKINIGSFEKNQNILLPTLKNRCFFKRSQKIACKTLKF